MCRRVTDFAPHLPRRAQTHFGLATAELDYLVCDRGCVPRLCFTGQHAPD